MDERVSFQSNRGAASASLYCGQITKYSYIVFTENDVLF